MSPHLEFLLSVLYADDPPYFEHLIDLRGSGLTNVTIARQKIRSVPPHMIDQLLGFPAPKVAHAYLIPFADPRGGWMDHVRMRVFPPYKDKAGRSVKYLGPRTASPRLFFPVSTMETVTRSDAPLWCVEGAKKSLAVAQLELPAVGFEGIQGWHVAGTRALLADFDTIPLAGRTVELVPDGDVATNTNVRRGAEALALALARRGARPRLVALPKGIAA